MKKIISSGIAACIVLIVSSSAMATGVGIYGEFQRGLTSARDGFVGSTDNVGMEGGLVLDTNVAKNSLVNYRLRVGAGQFWASDLTFTRVSLVQIFGISPAGARNDMVRYWFGPRIGLHYLHGDISKVAGTDLSTSYILLMTGYMFPMVQAGTVTLHGFKGDIGLVLAGLNFNFGPIVTVSFELGFNYGFMLGRAKFSTTSKSIPAATGEEIEGFATIAFLFRIKDTYSGNEVSHPDKKINMEMQ